MNLANLKILKDRQFDLACLGRLAVDLYGQQIGSPLEDVSSFAKYLGGSSANLAFGVARLGCKSAMISRVGNEQMGRYLIETLQQEGCDTSQVQIDPKRLTALVLLGIKDQETFPLLFVRTDCADMALDADFIDESFIAQCRALAITGTHLSTSGTRAASHQALQYAKKHGVLTVLDIDYRPVLWGLTPLGAGENRYVPDAHVTEQLQASLPFFDLLVGTEEEFLIAGGVANNLIESLRVVRKLCPQATLVMKRGALGCCVIEGAVPSAIEDAVTFQGERVEVLNVLGAGDAFLSGLMASLLQGKTWPEAMRIANACGALVVSRHACSDAMPTPAELDYWFTSNSQHGTIRPEQASELARLHRVSTKRKNWNNLCVLAFDHRSQFVDLARAGGVAAEQAVQRIATIKKLLVQAVEEVAKASAADQQLGVLIDGSPLGRSALASATGQGWWVGRPVEQPGARPLCFDGTRSIGSDLTAWPREQVVKCLVFYHPDDAFDLRHAQEQKLLELWQAVCTSGHELLIEVILPPDVKQGASLDAKDAAVLRSVQRLYNLGIKPNWWKLAPMQGRGWQKLQELIQDRDPYCRGAVILGLNQPLDHLAQSFRQATNPIVKGFMVGRSIWADASLRWFKQEMGDTAYVQEVSRNFVHLIQAWHHRKD